MASGQELLEAGRQALAARDWPAAEEAFRAALEVDESGGALAGLADALWWHGDPAAALDCSKRSYAAFRRESDHPLAATLALSVCRGEWAHNGNRTAAAGGWPGPGGW